MIVSFFHHTNKDIKQSKQERKVLRRKVKCMYVHVCVFIGLHVHFHVRGGSRELHLFSAVCEQYNNAI